MKYNVYNADRLGDMPGQVGIFITKFITKESCVRHRNVIFKQRFKETDDPTDL